MPATKTKVTAESQAKAKKLYAMDCALCHGASGDGKTDLAKDMQLTMIDWTDSKIAGQHPGSGVVQDHPQRQRQDAGRRCGTGEG